MNHQNQYNFSHDSVREYFTRMLQNQTFLQYSLAERDLTDWLNNYTTLLYVWFCELLYCPTFTDNQSWESKLYNKLNNGTTLSITNIIQHFDIKTLQYNSTNLKGVNEFEQNILYYTSLYKNTNPCDFLKETLTSQRMNLTLRQFINIRRLHKKNLTTELKDKFPFNASMIIHPEISYHDITHDEETRESDIISYLLEFDGAFARPIFVKHGFIKDV